MVTQPLGESLPARSRDLDLHDVDVAQDGPVGVGGTDRLAQVPTDSVQNVVGVHDVLGNLLDGGLVA